MTTHSQSITPNPAIKNDFIHPTSLVPARLWQNAWAQSQQSQSIEKLERQSGYALIFVIHANDADEDWLEMTLKTEVSSVISDWAKRHGWHYADVEGEEHSKRDADFFNNHDDNLTPVYVFRYLLIAPDTCKETTAQDQLTNLTFNDILAPEQYDCHILPLSKMQPHKLAFFDMDSTLIEQEVIVELAKFAGIGEQVSEITESAMRGEIDFSESFRRRVALLKGLSTDVLDKICGQLTLSAGAKTLLSTLKANGYHTVLVSGGFTYFARHVAEELGIDEYHANELDIADGQVTGKVVMPIVDGNRKAQIVKQRANELRIPLDDVVCVGDGANDLEMMDVADLGIAYRAKPVVQEQADTAVNVTGLDGVAYVLVNLDTHKPFISKQTVIKIHG